MARIISEGASEKEIFDQAISLKVYPAQLDLIKTNKHFTKIVEQRVKTRALFAMARALPSIEALSHKSVPAFTALAKIAGAWPGSQVNINTQVTVGDRSGDNESDRAFHLAFQQRLRSGLVQRLVLLEGGSKPAGTPVEPALGP